MRTRPFPRRRRAPRPSPKLAQAVLEVLEQRRLLAAGTVSGTLYRDADADGARGPLEAVLAGRTVYLDLDGNDLLDATDVSTTTDAAGAYALPLPSTDPVIVRQVLPAGWEATGPASHVGGGDGDHVQKDFGSRDPAATGAVTAAVWRDANGDGRRDPGEAPIGGVGVYLDLDNDAAGDADEPGGATAPDTGVATIANVPAGAYAVRTLGAAGLVQTAPAAGAALNVTVGTDTVDAGAFGLGAAITGQVSGVVFDDANGDGIRQATETSILTGRVVYADLNNDGALSAGEPNVTSTASGYRLDLAPGSYTVRQVVPAGWRQTAPAAGAGASVVVTAYGTATQNFGTVRTTPPTAAAGGPYSLAEGGSVVLAGTATSPLGRPLTYEWDDNYDGVRFDVNLTGAAPTFRAGTLDGPSTRTLALRVRDDLGNVSAISTATVQIVNAAPTAASFTNAGPVTAGTTTTVTFAGATDASTADVAAGLRYSFDFDNNGTFEIVSATSPTATVPASYLAAAGTRTVRGRVADKDGGFRDYTTTITINPPPTNSPFSGTPIAVSATAMTTIQAENFDLGGEGVAWHDTDAANLGGNTTYRAGGVDLSTTTDGAPAVALSYVKAGEWLEYTVNVAKAGAYTVGFRVASLQAGGAMHLEVNGARVGGTVTVPDTGAWTNWRTITTSNVQLPVGRHVFKLAFDTGGALGFVANVNHLTITPPPAIPPLPGGYTGTPFRGTPAKVFATGTSTIEVENFDDGGEGRAYHDTTGTNDGGSPYHGATGVDLQAITDGTAAGVAITHTKAGEWVKFVVEVAADGTYDFDTRLASLTGGGNFHLEVDGTRVTPYLVVPRTGSWGAYATVRQAGVTLKAGWHVFKLAFDANGASGFVANFNWVKFTRR